MSTVLIFAGGEDLESSVLDEVPSEAVVIAANGGYAVATKLGLRVDVLVGDLDSVDPRDVPGHVVVERHTPDKDHTDLDLAIELATLDDPERVIVVGGAGGRHDHELATAFMLTSPRWSGIDEMDWISGRSRSHVVRGRRMIHGDVGTTLSLIPGVEGAYGVATKGLRWDLAGDDLPGGVTRGVSNVMTSPVATVAVALGCLLVVIPVDQP